MVRRPGGLYSRSGALGVVRRSSRNWVDVSLALAMKREYNRIVVKPRVQGGTTLEANHWLSAYSYCIFLDLVERLSLPKSDCLYYAEIVRDVEAKISSLPRSESKVIGGAIGPEEAVVFALTRLLKPNLVMETGVAAGVSTYFILGALNLNQFGQLLSVDLPHRDPKGYKFDDGSFDGTYTPPRFDPGWLVPAGLRSRWKLKVGKSMSILPLLDVAPDFFMHDSDHSYVCMTSEYEWAYAHLKQNGVLISDDTWCNDAWNDFSRRHRDMKPACDRKKKSIAEFVLVKHERMLNASVEDSY